MYGALASAGSPFDVTQLASDCQSITVSFTPLQLTHAPCADGSTAFLLCGSDGRTHLFLEDRASREFAEAPLAAHFPEIERLGGRVLFLSVLHQPEHARRLVAAGCQDGSVAVAVVDTATNATVQAATVALDSPVPFVAFFADSVACPSGALRAALPPAKDAGVAVAAAEPVQLLVGSALDGSFVYR